MPSFEKRRSSEEPEIPSSESITANAEFTLTPEHASTMERHKRGRLELLKDIITSQTVDIALNFVPVIDAPKLAIEGMLGRTLSNETLTSRKRFDHMLISGGIALAYVLAAFGSPDAALAARGVAGIIAKVEFGPEMMRDIAHKTKEKFPKAAAFLDKTGSYFADKREEFFEGVQSIGPEVEKYLSEVRPELAPM